MSDPIQVSYATIASILMLLTVVIGPCYAIVKWSDISLHESPNVPANNKGHFMAPFHRNAGFVGRELILQYPTESVHPRKKDGKCQRTAIVGLGGVGKTQVALQVAFRIQELYRNCSIFWVPAMDATSFENAYHQVARKLNIAMDYNDTDVKYLVETVLSQEESGDWLLIVDNADDQELFFGKPGETNESPPASYLDQYLPFSPTGSILFTTRNHEAAVDLLGLTDHRVTVQEMSKTEAITLLEMGLTEKQTGDAVKTAKLLKILQNLPLAIRQASAFMIKKQITMAEYLELCRLSDENMIELLSRHFEDSHHYKSLQTRLQQRG